jgi:hypothetical protein
MLYDYDTLAKDAVGTDPALVAEVRGWLVEFAPTYLVTFNFNAEITLFSAHRAMRDTFKRVEHKRNGRNWAKRPKNHRLRAVGLMENVNSNGHCHALVSVTGDWDRALMHEGPKIWERIRPGGQMDVRRVWDMAGIAAYVTKQIHMSNRHDLTFLYAPGVP